MPGVSKENFQRPQCVVENFKGLYDLQTYALYWQLAFYLQAVLECVYAQARIFISVIGQMLLCRFMKSIENSRALTGPFLPHYAVRNVLRKGKNSVVNFLGIQYDSERNYSLREWLPTAARILSSARGSYR